MTPVNTDQVIFDAIAAATRVDALEEAVVINTKAFIDTFNAHRDRKLCTSLNPLSDNGSSDEDRHGGSTPSGGATRSDSGSAELLARLRDYLVMNMHSGSDLGPKFIREIDEALRGVAQASRIETLEADVAASEHNFKTMRQLRNEAAARIEALEAALREIVAGLDRFDDGKRTSDYGQGILKGLTAAADIARTALAPEQDK
jgi:hypothetical protein